MPAGNDINLDWEFKEIVREYGWWIVLRSFDVTRHSKYWKHQTGEAINGPAWEYNDIIFKARRVETSNLYNERHHARQQYTGIFDCIYFIISNVRPKKEDVIFGIPEDLKQVPTPPRRVKVMEQFDIEHVESKIEKGLIFSKCYCTRKTPERDETIEGLIPVRRARINYSTLGLGSDRACCC